MRGLICPLRLDVLLVPEFRSSCDLVHLEVFVFCMSYSAYFTHMKDKNVYSYNKHIEIVTFWLYNVFGC